MNTYIYIHVCCMNQWREVFSSLIGRIKASGLYDEVKEIRCGVVGAGTTGTMFDDPKIVIAGHSDDLKLFETSTLNLLHEHAQREDFDVLYLHTKGVSHRTGTPLHAHVVDWVNYMCHFNIDQHAICRKQLQAYDAVGVNLQGAEPSSCLHYSGNFWWSKAAYIRSLDRCVQSGHNAPEFWLTESRAGSYLSLWTSGVNHYDEPYPSDRYVGLTASDGTRRSWPPPAQGSRQTNDRLADV